eukprot:CAMPEP_0185730890 /NCGR_PEP_ID=MMETSP1171-20130828/11299_1 /TAXON_ID=374046 /ORGANISM="Helicotheca tamensis, Strain CCMP826" /LENGTH=172 /DNA_ID=CAMNT_0028400037 /DNA_START=183 /DNA_END=701 /DNA_ORIENTATION=-
MAADGMDVETVKTVPQLHLARLFRDGSTIYGAKVVNRVLGKPVEVCGPLVEAALKDAGNQPRALSTLHGLTDWVAKGVDDNETAEKFFSFNIEEIDAIKKMIEKHAMIKDDYVYNAGKKGIELLAEEFIQKGLGDEASLYQSKGGQFFSIDHRGDTSEYADASFGAMAVFKF